MKNGGGGAKFSAIFTFSVCKCWCVLLGQVCYNGISSFVLEKAGGKNCWTLFLPCIVKNYLYFAVCRWGFGWTSSRTQTLPLMSTRPTSWTPALLWWGRHSWMLARRVSIDSAKTHHPASFCMPKISPSTSSGWKGEKVFLACDIHPISFTSAESDGCFHRKRLWLRTDQEIGFRFVFVGTLIDYSSECLCFGCPSTVWLCMDTFLWLPPQVIKQ